MKKILITHVYSENNKGDLGIILGTLSLLNQNVKDYHVKMMSMFGSNDSGFYSDYKYLRKRNIDIVCSLWPNVIIEGSETKSSLMLRGKSIISYIFSFLKAMLILVLVRPLGNKIKLILNLEERKALEAILDADIIISKGGSFLYSQKGLRGLFFFVRILYPFMLGQVLRKSTIILVQSIGPLENRIAKLLGKIVMNRINVILVREELSLVVLSKMSVTRPYIRLTADSAFALPNPTKQLGVRILESFGVPMQKTLLGITVRSLVFQDNISKAETRLLYKNYLKSMADAVNVILDEYESFVVLMPQVPGPQDLENDIIVSREILKFIKRKDRVVIIEYDMSPDEIKSVYGNMDLFIGTRLHSCIFALCMNVPTISISYMGTKTHGIMKMLGLSEYVVDICDVNPERLLLLLRKILEEKSFLNLRIQSKIDEIKNLAEISIIRRA